MSDMMRGELTIEKATAAALSLLTPSGTGPAVDDARLLSIERFLRMEARILDEERWRDWYGLLADDLLYWAPTREDRYRRDKRPELSPDGMAFYDDRKSDIDLRIKRLETGMAWSEDPPTRHVYLITNVEAFETDIDDEFEVHSAFVQHRHRGAHDTSTLFGRRRDVLRRSDDGYLISRRLILLQQAVLSAKNLSVFF